MTASERNNGWVTIKIVNNPYSVHPGEHKVAELKQMAGIPEDENLEQVVEGRIVELDDRGKIHLHGGECFVVVGTGTAS